MFGVDNLVFWDDFVSGFWFYLWWVVLLFAGVIGNPCFRGEFGGVVGLSSLQMNEFEKEKL